MKVLHIGQSIDRSYGGPARSIQGLAAAEAKLGVETAVVSLTPGQCPWVSGIGEFEATDDPTGMMGRFEPDLVHLHGLWGFGLHRAAVICRRWKIPYVISPRGMLDPWALKQKGLKKRIARLLYQDSDLKHAAALHATAELEAGHIRALGFKNWIILSPNGVEMPTGGIVDNLGTGRETRVALFLSRLHPGKGLLTLADAWARVRPQGWAMRVVGPDLYGHKTEVLAKLDLLGIRSHWEFVDMVDDTEKWREYAAADLLIHPSVSENFGMTIAEGLAAGLPVICTKGTPWWDVEDRRCGCWIEIGIEPLVAALKQMLNCSVDELREMGARGRQLVNEKYTWQAAATLMLKGYSEVLSEGR